MRCLLDCNAVDDTQVRQRTWSDVVLGAVLADGHGQAPALERVCDMLHSGFVDAP